MADKIIVLDFGSQYNQLIARRIREFGVYSELHPHTMTLEEILALKDVRGIIFSGGPNSVYVRKHSNAILQFLNPGFLFSAFVTVCR